MCDSRNVNSENSGNISGNNSSEIGLNNSSNEISNNSDSVNENLSVNNLSVNNLSVNRSSINRSNRKCSKVFNFLLGGRRKYNRNKIEWENLCKYQLKSGSLSDIPFLAKTALHLIVLVTVFVVTKENKLSYIGFYCAPL
ncbi:hypothetical protein PIROE2DRAFT_15165 [Piromyces sp. E2]|nr:hypothetical protein PIROE2DRAFT_15165 [Piromyces sp. E2]|eukprot:OUM59339.1 hypothetical protein PIROE2DRAFT_15165 [Piromyces sp. E2]